MTFKPEELLADAIRAGRKALRDLDSDQVPASMRRIAAYAGGTLPPPFARSLLAELDENGFLRERALESWPGDRPPAAGTALASYLYLVRDDGWKVRLLAVAHQQGVSSGAAEDRNLESERDALVAEVASLRERLKRARKEKEDARAQLREMRSAERAPLRWERAAEQRMAEELKGERTQRAEEADSFREELAGLRGELTELREAMRVEGRLRADAEAALRAAATDPGPATGPIELADRLDALAARAGAMISPGTIDVPDELEAVSVATFDRTIRPDRSAAIEWLASAGRRTVLIDGYNLGFALGSKEAATARTLAEEVSGRLAIAAPEVKVVLVFDSDHESPDHLGRGSRLVTVRFTPPERTADDEIVALVGADGPTVVVSNDRELRDRAEAAGAVALWSDALAEWSRQR